MSHQAAIAVDLVSDVVCPWCYLGAKRLERAIESAPDLDVRVTWRPYQLDPSIPAQGVDRHAYMRAKFGDDGRLDAAQQRLQELGRAEDIDFRFEAIQKSPNTLDAHRLLRWASAAGAQIQHRLAMRLFAIYFEEGRDIGDRTVLLEAAGDVGMDVALTDTLLASGADRDEVESEIATAREMGVTGVPCFVLGGKYAVMGAQDVATLTDAMRKVAEAGPGRTGYADDMEG